MVHDTTRRRDKNSHTGLHRANLPPPPRRTVPRHTPALRRSPTAPDAGKQRAMSASNVAVIGAGITGAVCASLLAARGVAVTLFDSGRGPGGRMAQRREKMEDGTELRFDHGAPYFTVSNDEVARVVSGWEARGIVAEWKAMFACFDRATGKFTDFEKVPVHGFSFNNSDFLSWAFCDSSKPGRACVPSNRQSWVLHSTAEYASKVINDIGPRKPSADALAKVAEELFKEFQSTGLNIPQPIFMKAHRWSVSQPCLTGSLSLTMIK
ncbi:hypothetical protein PR202_ga13696 [Eleusine coracana subsp. coracana]|uniref:Amine oxidase domain-containing protein n=1 Tax=Eleusine coracana subsp. coracana TaxID=191504 RepID=A0AAV5CEZ5_ELECO|nr:hypothetical protein PR202_ga13696 [Eleusine coracana subsp. coracana]